MRPLLPLYVHPDDDPAAWRAAAACGGSLTVVVNVHNGPGEGPAPEYVRVTRMLADAGVRMLGYVYLGYGARPLAEVLSDFMLWRAYPVSGVFLDCAPTDEAMAGPVALAVRASRRLGLPTVVLNPGAPAHLAYHQLADGVGTFEGSWSQYRRWPRGPDRTNACHLVYGVPPDELSDALALVRTREAGWGVVTERGLPLPWQGFPRWLHGMARR